MFLTSIKLNPARRETRKLVASPQAMHAAVLCGFPPGPADREEEGRVLWRLDRRSAHELMLWVSSPERPDYRGLVEQASWPEAPEAWRTADAAPFLQRLEKGQQWQFRVTVNPVVSRKAIEHDRGRVQAHVTVAQQSAWLTSRCADQGFMILHNHVEEPTLTLRERRTLQFERRTDGQRRRVTVSTATFDGFLEVTDPDALRQLLTRGLGRAKAYGCGLMTLAPPR